MRRFAFLFALCPLALAACSSGSSGEPGHDAGADASHDAAADAPEDAPKDAPHDAPPPFEGGIAHPCTLPGSVQTTAGGQVVVPGGHAGDPDLAWLHLPVGFCAHYFGTVGNARQLRFAPGGELFVASPVASTTGGGPNGQSAIVVLPDDDADGYADPQVTFLPNLPSTQGLLFTPGLFYYQNATKIMRMPYAPGDRAPSGAAQVFTDVTIYTSGIHWPKALDAADDGTIFVGNGGDEGEQCDATRPFHGGVLSFDPKGPLPVAGKQVAKGLRNPIAVGCARGHNRCFATELAKDYSANENGREKLIPVPVPGNTGAVDDWGFPCCATKDLPYTNVSPVPDCSGVVAENDSFVIGGTPFGVDFEHGAWPAPWAGSAYVPLHGAFGTWVGARMVAIKMDPTTGLPLPGSDLDGGSSGAMSDFATGWDDGTRTHGRPAAVAFSADGRLFLANDTTGEILWIAPMDP